MAPAHPACAFGAEGRTRGKPKSDIPDELLGDVKRVLDALDSEEGIHPAGSLRHLDARQAPQTTDQLRAGSTQIRPDRCHQPFTLGQRRQRRPLGGFGDTGCAV